MRKIRDHLVLLAFMGGVLVGIQVPGFVDQYGKSLQAHYRESAASLGAFQDDADRFFGGDLQKLIAHYRKEADPVFHDGGDSIEAIYSRNRILADAMHTFNQNAYSRYLHVFLNPLRDIEKEVWQGYTYTIRLDKAAIVGGLATGFLALVAAELGFLLLAGVTRRFMGALPPLRKARG